MEKKVKKGVIFDKPSIDPEEEGPTCDSISSQSFGQSGWTGTLAWADPLEGIVYIFLSNGRSYPNGKNTNAEEFQMPVSDEFYFIATDKCTECKGFHEEPQCAAVCPVDCCIPDDKNVESEEELLKKQSFMHKSD